MKPDIFNSNINFEEIALEIFRYQAAENKIYKAYLSKLKIKPPKIKAVETIPFLPISFFKTHDIITGEANIQQLFTSSGTTGAETSKHFVKDINLYKNSFIKCFELFYGNVSEYCILALLPSYLERQDSSLVYMAEHLIRDSENPLSGFYLNEFDKLKNTLEQLQKQEQKTILLGVSFALLDFVDFLKPPFGGFRGLIMETGGMKGRRKEMIREELHNILCSAFNVDVIHSEYGMTELLSQAYSQGNGIYKCPPWMKVLIRDINDPFEVSNSQRGGINVIDLANINSCSFIATQDLGKLYPDGSFEVLGRFDYSDLRGCNLMVE